MTTFQPRAFIDPDLIPREDALDRLSQTEMIDMELGKDPFRGFDPDIKAAAETFGSTMTGIASGFFGKVGLSLGLELDGMIRTAEGDKSYLTPVNFNERTKPPQNLMDRGLAESLGEWQTFNKNNIESISDDLASIPPSEWSYVLEGAAQSYGEYQERLMRVKFYSPQFAAMGNTLGKSVSFVADATGIILSSLALEPLAFAATGARAGLVEAGTAIGARASVPTFGRSVIITNEAVEAAATLTTLGNIGRYAALGVAEEAVIKLVKNGFDPTYEPEYHSIATDFVLSATLGASLGGWAGRGYATSLVESTANRYVHRVNVGRSAISMRTGFAFTSTAAADFRLLGMEAQGVLQSLDTIGAEAWQTYAINAEELVPNTRTMELPLLQRSATPAGASAAPTAPADIGVQMMRGMFRPANFGEASYTRGGSALLRTILNGAERSAVPAEFAGETRAIRNASGVPDDVRGFRPRGVVMSNTRQSRDAFVQVTDEAGNTRQQLTQSITPDPIRQGDGGQGLDDAIELEFNSSRMYGSPLESPSRQVEEAQGIINFIYGGSWRNLRESLRSVTLRTNAPELELSSVRNIMQTRGWNRRVLDNGDEVFTPPSAPRFTRSNENFRLAVRGVQSNVLSLVAEIQRRGGEVNEALTQQLTHVVYNAYSAGLRGAPAESQIWSQIERMVDPAVWNRISEARRLGNGPRLANLANDFDILTEREEFIDGLWEMFQQGDQVGARGTDSSLILQTANEIRRRGGTLDRDGIASLVDDLRQLMQNPPMRTNKNGVQTLDTKARITQLGQIINRRVPLASNQIYIPNYMRSTLRNFGPPPGGGAGLAGAGAGGGIGLRGTGGTGGPAAPTPQGTVAGMNQMQREVPHLTGMDTLGGLQQLFNQAANVLRHNNPVVRMFGFTGFNARRAMNTPDGTMVAQGQTVFEAGTYEMVGFMARGLLTWRNAYTRYALNRSVNDRIGMADGLRAAFGRGAADTRRRFNAALNRQIRSGAFNDPSDAVNEAARSIRQILNEMHTVASQANVRGFQQGAQLNYLSRIYRWNRIGQLGQTPEGRAALRELLERSLGGTTGQRQLMLEDGSIIQLTDVPEAARVLSERLISLANNSDNAPLLDIDQALSDALDDLDAALRPASSSRTPFGRARIMMDEESSIQTTRDFLGLGTTELRFSDLLADDVPLIMKRYLTSVMGAVNERRMLDELTAQMSHYGIIGPNATPLEPFQTFEEFFAFANRVGTEVHGMGGQVDEGTMSSMREIVAALRYEPLHRSNSELGSLARFGDKALAVMLPLSYMATGGAFALAALTETSRIMGTLGMASTLKQMPILGEMVDNFRNMDEGAYSMSVFVDQAFHPSTDRLRRALFYDVENQVRGQEPSALISGLNSASNFFSDITLLSPVTSFTQNLAAATSMQHLLDVARNNAARLDDATVRTLGLEPAQYNDLIQWVGNNANTINRGRAGERIVGLNSLAGPEFNNLRLFIDRMVRTRIQDIPTRGDFARAAFGFFGRLMTQFRTFNLKGVDNFMLQNLSRARRGGGVGVAKEIGATMVFAGIVQYARQYMNYESELANGNYTEAEKIADSFLGVKGFTKGAFTGPSEFFLPIMATDALWTQTVSDDPVFSAYRYSGLNWYGFPAQSFISKTYDVGRDIYGATVARAIGLDERERQITKGTIHKARMLIPLANAPGFKHFFNIAETEIAREFDLAKQQPRKN